MTTATVSSPSLALRAVYALLLMFGFYLLALSIAGILFYLPYAEWRYVHRIDFRLAAFGVIGGIAILAAVAPRIDKFEPPGPRLEPTAHPRLFSLINETATATGQAPPVHVYLVPDVNAWVAQRGGLMGLGSERVMGVGLPLLQTLTVPEFNAVLAHEFGHFHGGDTRLGPWIYKTRGAIGRTLSAFSGEHTWLAKPFEWYGNMFLRITHGVSRQQELAADALAARTVGAAPLASGLKAIHSLAPAFPSFWSSEIAPALHAGVRPPIGEGFKEFIASPSVAPQITAILNNQLTTAVKDPYDTHPPLPERLAALGLSEVAPESPAPPAISLLDKVDTVEQELLAHLLPDEAFKKLKPAAWKEVGAQVWLPYWEEVVANNKARLAGVTVGELPTLAALPGGLAERLGLAPNAVSATDENIVESKFLVGAAIAVALHRGGFSFTAPVGAPPVFTVATSTFSPFMLVADLDSGAMSPELWAEITRLASLDTHDLAELAAS
jgi:Zn-dependent protease with chaperone function